MPKFTISTPGPQFVRSFPTIDAALDWTERYLPCTKRGYRRNRIVTDNGVGFTQVLNTKGKVVTGASIRLAAPGAKSTRLTPQRVAYNGKPLSDRKPATV